MVSGQLLDGGDFGAAGFGPGNWVGDALRRLDALCAARGAEGGARCGRLALRALAEQDLAAPWAVCGAGVRLAARHEGERAIDYVWDVGETAGVGAEGLATG